MRPRVVLFQNQIVAPNSMKITGLRKWYYQFRDIEIPPLIYSVSPQALIVETFARLTGMDFEMKLNSVQNKRKDEEHGSFPFMLYDNEFVPKESLITFLLEEVDIDSRLQLDPVKYQKIQLLRWLIIYRLNQALRYIQNQENLENSQFTSSLLFHPVTAMSILFKSMWQEEGLETNFGFTHRVDAESAIVDILSKLNAELDKKPLFTSEELSVHGICSLDILVFAYMKQMLTNFPRSSVFKIVKQFPRLVYFVQTMESILNTGACIEDVHFHQKAEQIASHMNLKPRIVVKNQVIGKIHNSERFKVGVSIGKGEQKEFIKKRKIVWLASLSVFSLMTYYNFFRVRMS